VEEEAVTELATSKESNCNICRDVCRKFIFQSHVKEYIYIYRMHGKSVSKLER